MSGNRYSAGGAGNQSYGYVISGAPQNTGVTSVDRIDYSNDTATAAAKGPVTRARHGVAATGNASYGYCGGGSSDTPSPGYISTVDRVDYLSLIHI